ncbi:hypothetical protein PFH44_14570 [Raoultella sp. Ech2A]|nr:hypothetical protein [Raoultella sp. Ech2A]
MSFVFSAVAVLSIRVIAPKIKIKVTMIIIISNVNFHGKRFLSKYYIWQANGGDIPARGGIPTASAVGE